MATGGLLIDVAGGIKASKPGVKVTTDHFVQGDGVRLAKFANMIDDFLRVTIS